MKNLKILKNSDHHLTNDEMKNIFGGYDLTEAGESGTGSDGKAGCCFLYTGHQPKCGLDQATAQAWYNLFKNAGATGIGWCCASC